MNMDNLEMLKWQNDMGVDEPMESSAVNNFAVKKPAPIKQEVVEPQKKVFANKITSPSDASAESRKLADAAETLKDLENAVRNFDGCSIKKTATNTVFSDGNPESEIMFIGEAPGAQEDIEGIPFCGASGKLLDNMLKWVDLTRKENFYISNTLFWRPPGNRKPTPEETAICRPFVEKHIALIKPKMLVLIGATATTSLLESKLGITKLRGKYYEYTNCYIEGAIPTAVIFHPSYLLRSPGQKRYMWQDLLSIKHKIKEL